MTLSAAAGGPCAGRISKPGGRISKPCRRNSKPGGAKSKSRGGKSKSRFLFKSSLVNWLPSFSCRPPGRCASFARGSDRVGRPRKEQRAIRPGAFPKSKPRCCASGKRMSTFQNGRFLGGIAGGRAGTAAARQKEAQSPLCSRDSKRGLVWTVAPRAERTVVFLICSLSSAILEP